MAIEAETERLMRNWAVWRVAAGMEAPGLVSSAYLLEARGRRGDVAIPLFDPEASEVNDAFLELQDKLKEAVVEYWVRAGTIDDKCRRIGCAKFTLYARLDRAHARIHAFRKALRERNDYTRRVLSHSYC